MFDTKDLKVHYYLNIYIKIPKMSQNLPLNLEILDSFIFSNKLKRKNK